jgi:hypothetical protein
MFFIFFEAPKLDARGFRGSQKKRNVPDFGHFHQENAFSFSVKNNPKKRTKYATIIRTTRGQQQLLWKMKEYNR